MISDENNRHKELIMLNVSFLKCAKKRDKFIGPVHAAFRLFLNLMHLTNRALNKRIHLYHREIAFFYTAYLVNNRYGI